MSGNMGFLFYKDFYSKFTDYDWNEIVTKKKSSEIKLAKNTVDHIKKTNDKILAFGKNRKIHPLFSAPFSLDLTTTYPGLVIGTGYHHETGVEGEFKIGFYFDYTTGLPVIPGSSVKGLLRSVFPKEGERYRDKKAEYISELLKNDENFDATTLEKINTKKKEATLEDKIIALAECIFEGIKNLKVTKATDKYLPMSQRDIFFDAFPIQTGKDGLFADDFITPHKENPLKNPVPLKFLKVAPGVTFRFNFDLHDGILSKEVKLKLFLNILLDMGVGAKTNVGYGQFDGSNIKKLRDDMDKKFAEKKQREERAAMTEGERREAEKAAFIEEIRHYQGQPAKLFDKWKKNNDLKNDKDVAQAMLQVFKNMPSNPQLKYLARVLKVEKSQLKKKFI